MAKHTLPQDFKSMFRHFATLCTKELNISASKLHQRCLTVSYGETLLF